MSDNAITTLRTPGNVSPTISDKGLLRGAIGLAIISLVGFGLLYPLAGVGLSQALFPSTANGSLIERDGKILGSALVAQPFSDNRYFQPRPSAADYDPMAVAGSNQARTNPDLRQRIDEARAAVAQRDGVAAADVPSELVTQSGGGIDPHISPQAAAIQVARVARARGVEREVVEATVARHTEGKQLGLLGQPRVNVLELNLALDALASPRSEPPTAQ
ncbi:MAG TPA: potassium-transporting ATPase subunit KdpC [Nitrosomonas europaea]|uniref:potassium-transporting ATPase subunit KdpC n=1 Tax=Betaproteobacteria TaxID=28216 RepID=UPI00256E5E33|nr:MULTISPECIES: potassium-transporting ATPase subunit KdpC [Betaproteobacteria]MDL1864826.1 potassium-transporting ATPase subunit KdpC [Betaproteobacteria bacterium PRO5]HRO22541.1 potassium-transporting ATPase subunit KdpC [Alcaligenes phenolicus]HUM74708.1 potassium-transporting ATPase subunit KdpC [Nitrosomonas europaea]